MRQHGDADGARYRHGQWLADGVTVVAVSDETGEERVEVFEGRHRRARCRGTSAASIAMRAAPRGRGSRIANHRNEVLIGDLDSGELTVIDRSDAGRTEDLAWSPDGAWLAYTFWTDAAALRDQAVRRRRQDGDAGHAARVPRLRAGVRSRRARYLYFLSIRTFDPVYDSVQFELAFPRAARPYLIALQAGGRRPSSRAPKG